MHAVPCVGARLPTRPGRGDDRRPARPGRKPPGGRLLANTLRRDVRRPDAPMRKAPWEYSSFNPRRSGRSNPGRCHVDSRPEVPDDPFTFDRLDAHGGARFAGRVCTRPGAGAGTGTSAPAMESAGPAGRTGHQLAESARASRWPRRVASGPPWLSEQPARAARRPRHQLGQPAGSGRRSGCEPIPAAAVSEVLAASGPARGAAGRSARRDAPCDARGRAA